MPEYLSPGVYVEEIDAGPKPIEGVSTSTAGAVGVTVRGPTERRHGPFTGKPELVTSFAEFVRKFGGYLSEPDDALKTAWAFNATEGGQWWQFPLAVKGFFDNGGQRLYVKRVFSSTATRANATFGQGIISELTQDAAPNDKFLRVRHLIGIEVGSNVSIYVNGFSIGAFQVTAYGGTGTLTLNNPVGQSLKAGRDFVQVIARQTVGAPAPGAPDPRLQVEAKSRGDWGGNEASETGIQAGNGLSVLIRPMVGAALKIMADPALGGNPFNTSLRDEAAAGATNIVVADDLTGRLAANDRVSIDGGEHVITAVAAPNSLTINPGVPAGTTWAKGTAVRRLRRANNPAAPSPTINVWNAAVLYPKALVELDNGTQKEVLSVQSVQGNAATLSGNLANAYYEEHRLRVIEAEVSARYRQNQAVETLETFANLRLVDDGSVNSLVTGVKERSYLIDLKAGDGFSATDLTAFPSVPPAAAGAPETYWKDLTGGRDSLDGLTVDDFVGVDGGSGNRTGIQALEDIDEISICLAPCIWSTTVQSALIQHCELLKDRFAILDSKDELDIEGIRVVRETIDTKYAALYYPWIEVRDPSIKRSVRVAPSGHMAGIYARVDGERGVHKAPGNEVIRGINKIAQDVTKRQQDLLNPKGINALRFFPGRGNLVWGARTLSSDSSWKYINVRRLFIFVEESIDEGTQWVVFEPNDEPLWARVRQTIIIFLTTVWHNGALQGTKPDEAFFVKCDRTTMTQDDIDNGRLICIIGIAPVKPAEFVIFRIQQKTQESQSA